MEAEFKDEGGHKPANTKKITKWAVKKLGRQHERGHTGRSVLMVFYGWRMQVSCAYEFPTSLLRLEPLQEGPTHPLLHTIY